MGVACVVSFAEFARQQIDREVREDLHAQFDTWLDQLEVRMSQQEKPATLAE